MTSEMSNKTEEDTIEPDWSRISIIIVTHHSAAVIYNCLKNFKKASNIFIVDNASDDETIAIAESMVPQARIFRNKIGVGYPGGANRGLSHVTTEFALTVNPDSVVAPSAVATLIETADRYPDAGIVCPQNINLDGTPELAHDVVLFDRDKIHPPYNKRRDEPAPEGELCSEFLSGAVNLIRMQAIHQLGGFDENLYLYFDDDDLCMRMRSAGYELILAPAAQIMHVNAGSVRPSIYYDWEKYWNYGWSRLYIEKKYNGFVSMLRISVYHLFKFFFKFIFNILLCKFKKSIRDFARFSGTLSYLLFIKSVKPSWKKINFENN